MADLEQIIRQAQDRLRGGPLPEPTWRERFSGRRHAFASWVEYGGLLWLAAACFGIAGLLQLFVAVVKVMD